MYFPLAKTHLSRLSLSNHQAEVFRLESSSSVIQGMISEPC